jgi:dTDP-4-amino-4,6-dideoxygalactose transaminase
VVADYTGAKYGIAVNSGTSAKNLANISLDKI